MHLNKLHVFIISIACAFTLSFILSKMESTRLSTQESSNLASENEKQIRFLENLFQNITLALNQTAQRYNGECSTDFLNTMRKSMFNMDGVIEIGIIRSGESEGTLICNSWGKNEFTVKKPLPHDGFLFSGPHTSNFYDERIAVIKKTTSDYEFNILIKQSSLENLLQNIQLLTPSSQQTELKDDEKKIDSQFIANISYIYQYKATATISNLFYSSIFLLSFALFYFVLVPYITYTLKKSNLRRKIQNDVFFNVYQPIIDSETDKVFSYEVFTRCKGRDGALGIIKDIKHYNLHIEHTLRQLEKLEEEKKMFNCTNFQINLSAKHLISDKLLDYFSKIAIASRREIIIEITEDEDLFKYNQQVKQAMKRLKNLEYRFALDDFGSGFSNFSYIFEFEFDFIKIDKSVLRFENHEFFQSFVEIFNTLDTPCIIEGVEDDADRKRLDVIDIKYHQGWLYGKPTTPSE